MIVTRFAPSPTGPLHLGHAYSALCARAVAGTGRLLLRIEDTDTTRSRPEYDAGILEDLAWLGIEWTGPVRRQSTRRAAYDAVLSDLARRGLVYPCGCTRRDILDAGAEMGAMGPVYPGTCRGRHPADARPGDAMRLDLRRALAQARALPTFEDCGPLHGGTHRVDPDFLLCEIGDPVLRRRGTGDSAYDLACPVDDADQGVTHVVRGEDLWQNTGLHVLLQTVLGWPVPTYVHHVLVRDADGRRLAKVDRSKALARYRDEGLSPAEVIALLPPLPVIPAVP